MSLVYKVKSTKTGLYSKGGTYPTFSKNGKAWTNVGYLKNHLNQLNSYGKWIYKDNQVIIECYEVIITENSVFTQSYDDFLAEIQQNQQLKKKDQEAKNRRLAENQRRLEYEKLKKEFEPTTSDIPEIKDWSNAVTGKFYTK